MSTTNALSDCTIMLYVMAERWPKAGRYRDTFERLKQLVLGRETAEEMDDNIILGPPSSATNETELGGAPRAMSSIENESSRHAGSSIPIPEAGATTRSGTATGSVIPNVIRNLVREPFPLWEGESFNLNFEALLPTSGPISNDVPWTRGDESFVLSNTTSFDFTFSPTGFGQPSDYDFDPVAFDYSPSGFHMNEYGGILEGVAGNRPGTRL